MSAPAVAFGYYPVLKTGTAAITAVHNTVSETYCVQDGVSLLALLTDMCLESFEVLLVCPTSSSSSLQTIQLCHHTASQSGLSSSQKVCNKEQKTAYSASKAGRTILNYFIIGGILIA